MLKFGCFLQLRGQTWSGAEAQPADQPKAKAWPALRPRRSFEYPDCRIAFPPSRCLIVAIPFPFTVKFRAISLLPVLALAIVPVGCEKAAPVAAGPDEKVLFDVVQENADAVNKKDVDAVMATIHPQSPKFAETREAVTRVFASVTPKVAPQDLKVIQSSPEEARIRLVLKTEKIEGERTVPVGLVEELETLRPDNGKWKIYDTEITNNHVRENTPTPATAASPAPRPEAPAGATLNPPPAADKPAR